MAPKKHFSGTMDSISASMWNDRWQMRPWTVSLMVLAQLAINILALVRADAPLFSCGTPSAQVEGCLTSLSAVMFPADGMYGDQPAGQALDSELAAGLVQRFPAGMSPAGAQDQVLFGAPPEDDVWHDASEEWDEAAAAGAPAACADHQAAAPAAAAAAAAADEAFQRNVHLVQNLHEAGYSMEEISTLVGVSSFLLW
jgi:hypothetical protein